ncbi:MAG: PEGA domain-containing protein [Spirochaetota bacterium]|nr:MAG: PEGA domain-containing protein [Spirochaetota bacterium]
MKRLMKIMRFTSIILIGVIGFSYRGICDFNPFEQRKITILRFENQGEADYDYVKESVVNSIYNYAISIPYVSLTDEEIIFLQNLSDLDEYKDLFEEAGRTIRYRMEPFVTKKEPVTGDFPISIHGHYLVESEDQVTLSISAYNLLTKKTYTEYETSTDLFTLMNKPQTWLVPFFKNFLRYKTHTVAISANPSDSLIFADDRLIGIGESSEALLSPGYHRITVRREGYRTFSDLIHISRDDYTKHVVLKEEIQQTVFYTTTPSAVRVYSGEKFAGETPLSVSITTQDRTLTFVKEGYVSKTVYTKEAMEGKGKHQVELITEEDKEKILNQAELHRKSSETLYYTGIGMLGLSIILGIEQTANLQKADLYRGIDSVKHSQALDTTNTLSYLTAASSVVTAGIFVFSFIEMLKYFNLYNYNESSTGGNILQKEVRF